VYSVYPASIPSVLPRRAGAKGKDSKPAGAVYALEGSVAYSGSVIQWLRDNLQVQYNQAMKTAVLCAVAAPLVVVHQWSCVPPGFCVELVYPGHCRLKVLYGPRFRVCGCRQTGAAV
jgi:hypothetical protein